MMQASKVEHLFALWKEAQCGGKLAKGLVYYKLRHRLQLQQVHHELHQHVLLQQQ